MENNDTLNLNFNFNFEAKITKPMFINLFKRLKLELNKSNIESSKDYLCKLKNNSKNMYDVCTNILKDDEYKNNDIILTCAVFVDLLNSVVNNYNVSNLNEYTKPFYLFHCFQHLHGKKYFPDYKILSTDGSLEDFRKIFNGFCEIDEVK